jgi:hypothetical protein
VIALETQWLALSNVVAIYISSKGTWEVAKTEDRWKLFVVGGCMIRNLSCSSIYRLIASAALYGMGATIPLVKGPKSSMFTARIETRSEVEVRMMRCALPGLDLTWAVVRW